MPEDFSNEGLYRLIEGMRDQHGDDLREIRRQTTETNGRVRALESRANRNDQELKRLNSAVFPRQAIVDTAPPKIPTSADTVDLRLSPRMWTLLAATASGFGMLMPALNELLGKLIEKWF